MIRTPLTVLCTALLAVVVSGPAAAGGLTVTEDGYRLRLPEGFRPAPSSRGTKLQARVQGLMAGSGLPLSGSPSGRVFVRMGEGQPATLVVLRYRMPAGAGLRDGSDLNADHLSRAWAVAVGASGREAVRDVRKEQLNGLHTGVKATLVEARGPGDTAEVRVALTAAHGQILVLAYDAPTGAPLEHSEAFEGVLKGLAVVAPGRNWGLYLKYGVIVGVGLLLLLVGWWFVLRPRHGELWPGRPGKASTHIRTADGLGVFDHPAEEPAPAPSFLQKKALTNPLDVDPFAAGQPPEGAVQPLPLPTVGEDWDPENDPAFAVPEDEPAAPAPESAPAAGRKRQITRNLDALFGE